MDRSGHAVPTPQPWFRSLDRRQWKTLLATNLAWLFDGYETYALIISVGAALHQLLAPSELPRLPAYAGAVIAITLFGWGVGGILGGILADYFGRKRTMIAAVLAYSLTTGLSALSYDWISFAILRFVVGVAIGSEWATGSALVAELWPSAARGRGAGLMQSGIAIGFFAASLAWFFVGGLGPNAWRYMFLIGILPALLVAWLQRGMPESEMWQRSREENRAVRSSAARPPASSRFTLLEIFADPVIRVRTIIALVTALSTTCAWWGVSSWVTPYVGSVAAKAGLSGPQWAGLAGMAYNFGGLFGQVAFGFAADAWGRKPVLIVFFVLSLIFTPVLFLWTHTPSLLLVAACVNGFFTVGQWVWMPAWLPELYPTRMRGTGIALCFNAPRFVSVIGPLTAGAIIAGLGGFGMAATIMGSIYIVGIISTPFLPETRGQPLLETSPALG